MPAEELAVVIGALIGAMIAAFGAVGLIGWRLWRGLSKVLKGTNAVEKELTEALGHREKPAAGQAPADDEHPHRRQTGIFALAVRDEITAQVEPIATRLGGMEKRLGGVEVQLVDLQGSATSQAKLISGLSRHRLGLAEQPAEDQVIERRRHEESAARNLAAAAKASQSTARGAVPG